MHSSHTAELKLTPTKREDENYFEEKEWMLDMFMNKFCEKVKAKRVERVPCFSLKQRTLPRKIAYIPKFYFQYHTEISNG
jgi:hypothetical protein